MRGGVGWGGEGFGTWVLFVALLDFLVKAGGWEMRRSSKVVYGVLFCKP